MSVAASLIREQQAIVTVPCVFEDGKQNVHLSMHVGAHATNVPEVWLWLRQRCGARTLLVRLEPTAVRLLAHRLLTEANEAVKRSGRG